MSTTMTSGERAEIGRMLRMRGKVAKQDLVARGAEQMAVIEEQLSARFKRDHEAWAKVTRMADAAVAKADAAIAEQCRMLGVPETFRPSLYLGWSSRGENATAERRTELRMLARAEIDARVKRASVEVDRAVSDRLQQLVSGAIESSEGRAFIDDMPTIDQLLPAPSLEAIEKIAANGTTQRIERLRLMGL